MDTQKSSDITTRLNNAKRSFVEPHDSSIKFMKYAFRDEYSMIGTGKTASAALLAMNYNSRLDKSFID